MAIACIYGALNILKTLLILCFENDEVVDENVHVNGKILPRHISDLSPQSRGKTSYNCTFALLHSPMRTIFSIPELVWAVAIHLNSQADVSALSRCCRSLHASTVPVLYRNIEFSIFRVDSFAEAMRKNPSFSRHFRRLTITLNGKPQERQFLAYDTAITNDSSQYQSALSIRGEILADVAHVVDQCISCENLRHLSYTLRTSSDLSVNWIIAAFGLWQGFLWSKKSLRSLQYSAGGMNALATDKVSRFTGKTAASITEME